MKSVLDSIISLSFLVILPSLYNMKYTSLNPLIDVGKEIYCQHGQNNNTIFQIKKSGDIYTKVYKIIIPNLTAAELWFKNGTFSDSPHEEGVGSLQATNKDDYIPVNEGEQYFFKIYGLNFYKAVPLLFLDEKNNYIKEYFAGNYSSSQKGVEITVPHGAKKCILQILMAQFIYTKILYMANKEINRFCLNATIIMEKMNDLYKEYAQNTTVYKQAKKPYII